MFQTIKRLIDKYKSVIEIIEGLLILIAIPLVIIGIGSGYSYISNILKQPQQAAEQKRIDEQKAKDKVKQQQEKADFSKYLDDLSMICNGNVSDVTGEQLNQCYYFSEDLKNRGNKNPNSDFDYVDKETYDDYLKDNPLPKNCLEKVSQLKPSDLSQCLHSYDELNPPDNTDTSQN